MIGHLVVDRHSASLMDEATAVFSPDRVYRYALTRIWDPRRPLVAFVMLNPSKADAFAEDPTLRRCISFARSWSAGGLLVLNAFALRSTNPAALYHHPDPVGPDNDVVIAEYLSAAGPRVDKVVCAWGTHGKLHGRDKRVLQLLRARGVRPLCLGLTKDGHPHHPVRLSRTTPTVDYPGVPSTSAEGATLRRGV